MKDEMLMKHGEVCNEVFYFMEDHPYITYVLGVLDVVACGYMVISVFKKAFKHALKKTKK